MDKIPSFLDEASASDLGVMAAAAGGGVGSFSSATAATEQEVQLAAEAKK